MFSRMISAVPLLFSLVNAYSNPITCTGACYAHDPSLIEAADGTWYKFNTGNGIGIWTAPSLEGSWTYKCDALPGGTTKIDLAGDTDLWAPDVSLVGSTYYMYYAVSTSGTQNSAIGYATSTTLECGSWTDHGSSGVSSTSAKAYNAIDPNLILVGDDYYLNFGSFWSDIYQVEMKNPPTGTAGSAAHNIERNATGTQPSEGSFMFYYDDYYYLLFSSGVCCGLSSSTPAGTEYHIAMCRSKSATGDFVDQDGVACLSNGGSTLLASHDDVYAPGGQGVLMTSSGPLLYYHYANPTIGISDADYLFGANYLTFSNGWPVV